jgi:hypothetical protein
MIMERSRYDEKTRRANIRVVIILLAIALGIYLYFLLSNLP